MSLQIGQQIGSYEITSLIGKGGMGEVYRARDSKLKREVAIKALPDEFSRDHDGKRNFTSGYCTRWQNLRGFRGWDDSPQGSRGDFHRELLRRDPTSSCCREVNRYSFLLCGRMVGLTENGSDEVNRVDRITVSGVSGYRR